MDNNSNKKCKNINKTVIFYELLILVIVLNLFLWSGIYIFRYGLNSKSDKTNTIIETATLDLEIVGSNYIKINNAKILNPDEIASSSSKYNFKVYHNKKSTVKNAIYYINLSNIKMTDNLKSKYFHWSLTNNGKVIAEGTFNNFKGKNLKLNEDGIILSKENTDNLVLTLWLVNDLDVNQNDLLNGQFSSEITLESYVYN